MVLRADAFFATAVEYILRPMKAWFLMAVVPRVGYGYIRVLRATMRISYRGREALAAARERSGNYILAFWHSRFVMMPYVYPDRNIVVLASQHRDAKMLGQILRRFGLETVEGSSSRGGSVGVRRILRAARSGKDVGITPDGPKGPRRSLKPGVVATAKLTGLPVIPVTFSTSSSFRLNSWDRTMIPKPFARGVFCYGDPVWVPRDLDAEGEEAYRVRLEDALDRLTDEADRAMGIEPEPPREPMEAT